MTKIYLIRHAEAEGNIFRRTQGHYNSLITKNGMRQIAALQARFADIHVDAVYSSNLCRTATTAQAIYVPKQLPLHTDARFREVFFGEFEDMPFGEFGRFHAETMNNFTQNPPAAVFPNGERFTEYTDRFLEAMTEYAEQNDGKTIVIVSHGSMLRGVQLRLFSPALTIAQIGHCDNTGVSLLYYENSSYRFDYINDASHLPEGISTLARQKWWRNNRASEDYNLWYRAAEDADEIRSLLPEVPAQGRGFIGMLNDDPVGLVWLRDNDGEDGELDQISVYEPYRGREFAIQFFGMAVYHYRAQGKRAVVFTVPKDNAAMLHFAEKYGCEPVAQDERAIRFRYSIAVPEIPETRS